MTKSAFILNLALAIFLFFLNGFLGKIKSTSKGIFGYDSFGFNKVNDANFAEHFFQKTVHPALIVAIAAAVLQGLSLNYLAKDLWLVVPLFWVLRFIYIILMNIGPFTNWRYELTSMAISVLIGEGTLFLLLRPLIDRNEKIFIDAEAFRDAFWFAAISYIAKVAWDISKESLSGYSMFPASKRVQTISKRYYKFKWKYGAQIDIQLRDNYHFEEEIAKNHFRCLVYAIMIYEDHCRPAVIRWIEYITKIFHLRSIMSLGIMQMQTTAIISNRTSINMAISKLYTAFYSESGTLMKKIIAAIYDYNPSEDYYSQVFTLYTNLLGENGLSLPDM